MTLKELSAEYEAAAVPLRTRLAELRHMLKATEDPEEIWHLRRRIAELTPMLTQMNDISWMLDRYYEKGGADRDDRYGFNGIRKPKKSALAKGACEDCPDGVDGTSASDFFGVPYAELEYIPYCTTSGRTQKHRTPHFEASRAKDSAFCEVSLDLPFELTIDQLSEHKRRSKNESD